MIGQYGGVIVDAVVANLVFELIDDLLALFLIQRYYN